MKTGGTAGLQTIEDLTVAEYRRVRDLVYRESGINLGDSKITLVRSRLNKRIRAHGFGSYTQYLNFVENDSTGDALCALLDSISTNTTHLFREIEHFHFLKRFLQEWSSRRSAGGSSKLRIWSAACSSGEEPYSIAMVVHQSLGDVPGVDARILATDISSQMLSRAKEGRFIEERLGPIPPDVKQKYLTVSRTGQQRAFTAIDAVRSMITFARFNLMTPQFPFKHGFDIVFCRNVMIYFDKPTQEALVRRIARVLHTGGYLLIGHSESLNGIQHELDNIQPAVYRKRGGA